MSLAARQRAVQIAEGEVQLARSELLSGQSELRRRVVQEWAPRALVAGAAALGFWIEGRIGPRETPSGSRAEPRPAGSVLSAGALSPATIALWLGVAETTMRMIKQLGPSLQASRQGEHAPVPVPRSDASPTSGSAAATYG